MPSIRWCDRKLMKFHELEAQARASSAPNSTTATNSSSAPPIRFGWWMRNSSASWKSRSVSSGMRRSSSQRGARSRSTGSSASALPHSSAYAGGAFVPVKDLFSGPHQHAGARADVLVEPLRVADAMRHSGDVRMHADRHHPRALLAFGVQPVETVDAAPQPFLRGMVLQHHHRNVVHLDGVRHRYDRPARGIDDAGLVVEHPVGDVFDAGFLEVVDGLVGLGQAGALPAARRLAGELLDRGDRLADRGALILDVMHRPLEVAVPHEFPAGLEARLRHARIALADGTINGQRRL